MNMTTKSCSTYLSQKLPHARHTVSRMLCPLAPAAPEYSVHNVSTGCRHSMQIGILLPLAMSARAGLIRGVWWWCCYRAAFVIAEIGAFDLIGRLGELQALH